MWNQVEQVLEEKVRPQLALHSGGVELLEIRDGVVTIRLLGQCANCPSAYLTTEELIYSELAAAVPGVKRVVAEQFVSNGLLEQAWSILKSRHGA